MLRQAPRHVPVPLTSSSTPRHFIWVLASCVFVTLCCGSWGPFTTGAHGEEIVVAVLTQRDHFHRRLTAAFQRRLAVQLELLDQNRRKVRNSQPQLIVNSNHTQNSNLTNSNSNSTRQQTPSNKLSATQSPPEVHVVYSHTMKGSDVAWTVFPFLQHVVEEHKTADWYLFCTESTVLNLEGVVEELRRHNSSAPLWLGHNAQDSTREKHGWGRHYLEGRMLMDQQLRGKLAPLLAFPVVEAGTAMSGALLRALVAAELPPSVDFNIVPWYEVAWAIHVTLDVAMTNAPVFCAGSASGSNSGAGGVCSTNVLTSAQAACNPVPINEIQFAIKTTQKYHSIRHPIVRQTWLPQAAPGRATFFSDASDPTHSDVVDVGVGNTERGHCEKAMGILRMLHDNKRFGDTQWIVLVDDDTLVSVPRLQRLLGCFDASQPLWIGEMFGYKAHQQYGYSFHTGGAGIAFTRSALAALLDPANVKEHMCECPQPQNPDDMHLGRCLRDMRATTIHRPEFHQESPGAYPEPYLTVHAHNAVTYHHFWDRALWPNDTAILSGYQRWLAV